MDQAQADAPKQRRTPPPELKDPVFLDGPGYLEMLKLKGLSDFSHLNGLWLRPAATEPGVWLIIDGVKRYAS